MNQIYLPSGMRDSILDEVVKKKELQQRIETVFRTYGYDEIITPSIEYLNTYKIAFDTLDESEMYKFFDQSSNVLSLRVDMTVPIARVCASKFKEASLPLRFRYCSNVYKVREKFAGKRSEVTDCGIELMGLDQKSDIEVLMCALDTMESFGIDTYTLELGNSNFFKMACSLLDLKEEDIKKLADLIDRKSMVELEEYLNTLQLSSKANSFFMTLPLLNGKEEALDKAKEICFDEKLLDEVLTLKNLYFDLSNLGYSDHITFDFGKVPHLEYYTGIIFEGFVEGVGVSVLSGGRYDQLLSKFDYDIPACGFSVKLDYLLDVLESKPQTIKKLYYPYSLQSKALQMAKELRKESPISLVPYNGDEIVIKEEEK